jgi:hypothetical protein
MKGNGSWSYFEYRHAALWSIATSGSRMNQTIDTERRLVSVIRSINGTRSLLDVSKRIAYNRNSFMIPLFLIFLKVSVHIARERPWKNSWCIWTISVFTIRANSLNFSSNFLLIEFRIRFIASSWHQMTSSLGMRNQNCRALRSSAARTDSSSINCQPWMIRQCARGRTFWKSLDFLNDYMAIWVDNSHPAEQWVSVSLFHFWTIDQSENTNYLFRCWLYSPPLIETRIRTHECEVQVCI